MLYKNPKVIFSISHFEKPEKLFQTFLSSFNEIKNQKLLIMGFTTQKMGNGHLNYKWNRKK